MAVTSEDKPNAESALAIAEETRRTVMADKERSTNVHNGKTISANFQALYDRMSDAQKQTAGGAFRSHIKRCGVNQMRTDENNGCTDAILNFRDPGGHRFDDTDGPNRCCPRCLAC